ncbi:S-adenosylmethionine--2-demethylmenaquinone methyltransferase [Malaciobacter molluscorum LMG 25693]|uniref:4-hydroxy-4-methyl-2-oxoglutarate aldolase n=1 Tax=Malaciobacter molluscorum LMG 25693 TaxID=870501 RepID=A0A2G1DL93_9BACT|nr:ribonuclease E activity regulator RraA [Malaciobacter molluscorum]AXX92025.1 ribonuclease activity regulator, RraA family [Malaciobacter molluscorum LMG 25693]PHO19257.1 S-adenosylmethionine--2-demethylmenaquinone methyltransferase [Malaciobacter molluscorum LMG 25693]RXJ96479.1 S-adenosylmethionine--2-demethylmenaquinone methyltransferase [Malaciobacter molluscorum]
MSISTADICDDFRDKAKIQVLSPKFKSYGGKTNFQGEVITVKLDKSNWLLLSMLKDEKGDGKVVVVDVDQAYYGIVGDRLMAFAKNNNYEAIIINGYVRDTNETVNIDVGLYAIGTCPQRNFEKTNSARDIELNFEGIKVNSGDYIYADCDGVIITEEKLV